MQYETWLAEFTRDKRWLSFSPQSEDHAVHSINRYDDGAGCLWEVGFTFTRRVVVRSGQLLEDGLGIDWGSWVTQHEIITPP